MHSLKLIHTKNYLKFVCRVDHSFSITNICSFFFDICSLKLMIEWQKKTNFIFTNETKSMLNLGILCLILMFSFTFIMFNLGRAYFDFKCLICSIDRKEHKNIECITRLTRAHTFTHTQTHIHYGTLISLKMIPSTIEQKCTSSRMWAHFVVVIERHIIGSDDEINNFNWKLMVLMWTNQLTCKGNGMFKPKFRH